MNSLSVMMMLFLGAACGSANRCEPGCQQGEFCVEYGSDVAGEGSTFSCRAVPSTCEEEASCDCLAAHDSFEFCVSHGSCTGTGAGLQLICPGG